MTKRPKKKKKVFAVKGPKPFFMSFRIKKLLSEKKVIGYFKHQIAIILNIRVIKSVLQLLVLSSN